MLALVQTAVDISAWEGILNRWGLPILILILVFYAGWQICSFLAPRIDRIVNAQIDFIKGLGTRIDSIDGKLDRIHDRLNDGRSPRK